MLHKVQENTDWKSKYQDAIKDIEARELEWERIEVLLRKTIGRLAIAGRGLDLRLDQQLRIIQDLSREKRNEQLAEALNELSEIVASLEDPQAVNKPRRSDPIMLMLELLQNIHFDAAQRGQLKEICSELLISVANGHDRDSIGVYIQKLSVLINENFDNLDQDARTSKILFRLLDMLALDESRDSKVRAQLENIQEFRDHELQALADLINEQLGTAGGKSSIDEVMTTLLERLAIVQGNSETTQEIQLRVQKGVDDEQWPDTLNDIVNSISNSLKKLDQEKRELEDFIVNVTEQLGEITRVISEDHRDHQSSHKDAQSLHDFVQEGMSLIQKNFQSSSNLKELKTEISKNIDAIRGGVDEFVDRLNERHEATEERNQRLTQQLSQMEQETQELQVMLQENRNKLMYDALTGVYSRMSYDERIIQELSRWTRYQTPFSYAILDIDHFKRINDSYGHNAGDKALKIVGQMMQSYVRQSDCVFRIGGEEFVLLLSSTDVNSASRMVENMRKGIAASSFHFKGEPVRLTLSAGITETREGDSIESIYERADAALYKAKHSGRNCQFIAD
ncbi:MAG: diguanylate cyclase [Gammaproteobacteria bacterium]|nr:diguanylate cyclase [Gammaproteobacteria bacterium]MDH3447025.1 diguanylate cyclase [Gammaproteobacteria bacterium]